MSASFVLITSLLLMSPDASQLENETNAGKWSVGAGVSFGIPFMGTLSSSGSSLGSLGRLYAPSYRVSAEYYTSHRLAWMLHASGDYQSSHTSTEHNQSLLPKGESQSMSLSLSGGPRWIFNPGQRVEVSGYAVLGASYFTGKSLKGPTGLTNINLAEPSETESTEEQEATDALDLEKNWVWSLGLSVGIAFDLELRDNLYLRMFSSLGSVSKTNEARKSQPAREDTASTTTSDSFGIQFDFRPGLELRMVF